MNPSSVDERVKLLKQRLGGVTGRQSFRNAQAELASMRAWYGRSKKELSSSKAKKVKTELKNATRRLDTLGNLNTIPTVRRSVMNRVRRRPAQKNAYTYANQISNYIENIGRALQTLGIWRSFPLMSTYHEGLGENHLLSLRWEGNLNTSMKPIRTRSVRVLVVPVTNANKTLKDVESSLNDIKPYIQQVRNINAASANTLDREWKRVWDQKTMNQRLVSRWSKLPKTKRDGLLKVQKDLSAKVQRNSRRADINARLRPQRTSREQEREYYGHNVLYPQTRRNPSSRGAMERFMFPRR